jgi:hypothetical protein
VLRFIVAAVGVPWFAERQPRTLESVGSLAIIIVCVRLHLWQSNVRYSKPAGPASVSNDACVVRGTLDSGAAR